MSKALVSVDTRPTAAARMSDGGVPAVERVCCACSSDCMSKALVSVDTRPTAAALMSDDVVPAAVTV